MFQSPLEVQRGEWGRGEAKWGGRLARGREETLMDDTSMGFTKVIAEDKDGLVA